jgi:hypothetical protein
VSQLSERGEEPSIPCLVFARMLWFLLQTDRTRHLDAHSEHPDFAKYGFQCFSRIFIQKWFWILQYIFFNISWLAYFFLPRTLFSRSNLSSSCECCSLLSDRLKLGLRENTKPEVPCVQCPPASPWVTAPSPCFANEQEGGRVAVRPRFPPDHF